MKKAWCIIVTSFCLSILSIQGCSNIINNPIINPPVNIWDGQLFSEGGLFYSILKPDSTVWGWGFNMCGILGDGTNIDSEVPVQVKNLKHIVAMDYYFGAAFAADSKGDIWFWGNYWIWAGNPFIDTNVTVPIKIANIKSIKSISAWVSCLSVLTTNGDVWLLQMNTDSPGLAQEPMKKLENVKSIHRWYSLCQDGKIFSTSQNELPNTPQGVVSFQSTNQRKVFLKDDGTVWAYGENSLGCLGDGTYNSTDIPVKVKNLENVAAISCNYENNLALKKDGTVWYWGFVKRDGDSLCSFNEPVKVNSLSNIKKIYASSSCMVMANDGSYYYFNVEDREIIKVNF